MRCSLKDAMPPGRALYGGWGLSSGGLITAGIDGISLRFEGRWSALGSLSSETINALFRAPGGSLRAVGNGGTILRKNTDGRWEKEVSGTLENLYALWGTSEDNLWAAGENTLLHFDGVSWAVEPNPSTRSLVRFRSIWGSSSQDIWMVDDHSPDQLFHFDGFTWKQSSIATDTAFEALWG
ncbi:MAG: hypothetical protein JRH20_25680, partial [Deltaproteobacteria bacterium]|nr:hypothetical protein [Deltaproteobacteria bacterium]